MPHLCASFTDPKKRGDGGMCTVRPEICLGSVNEAHKWGIPMSIKVSDRIILGDNFLSYVYLIYDFFCFLNS